jgi:hypothetical protein
MGRRWYRIPDPDNPDQYLSLPSTTTVLDVTLPLERRHNLQRAVMDDPISATLRRERGADRGKTFDRWVKNCLKSGKLLPSPSEVQPLAQRFGPYLRKLLGLGPFWCDELVYSIPLGYAGTLDFVCPRPGSGQLCLYELKTSAYRAWPQAVTEAELQAAAYYLAWANHHDPILEGGICTIHVTPYQVIENPIQGVQLGAVLKQWDWRRRQFGARFSESEADHYV